MTLVTGDAPGAGLPGPARAVLVGDRGATPPLPLVPRGGEFGRGTAETLRVVCPDVGRVHTIIVGHDADVDDGERTA